MQYPQIQFYRGSLVRLASGKLKQVEDLSSDDFLESAKLFKHRASHSTHSRSLNNLNFNLAQSNNNNSSRQQSSCCASTSHLLDYNNNNNNVGSNHNTINTTNTSSNPNSSSVFNSPEPTPSFDSSPTIDMMETDDEYTNHAHHNRQTHEEEEEDEDEELDVVTHCDSNNNNSLNNQQHQQQNTNANHIHSDDEEDLYIDSSVVRDFLEVRPPSSSSPASPGRNLSSKNNLHHDLNHLYPSTSASTSSTSSTSSSHSSHSPAANLTVLIKFFLESSRSVVFIEVPIEHPFFVFHRGWSSWNPQRTYDKFGLKCRKLKIGDTCISLIRRQSKLSTKQQQESDHCNVLFSSIKIKE